ncbi:MAG: sel1 repeat family protein [Alphaproteobacteria bacterium]|nr:sel1 repeat family protein [Alphaproteobacteria bacterium]
MKKNGYSGIYTMRALVKVLMGGVMMLGVGVSANAGEMLADNDGVLNPSEYTLERILHKVERNELTDLECIYGYETAKHGMHDPARIIVRHCAEVKKLPQSMTFMAWMDENGYGLDGGPDLVSAAKWDRRAAERGDSNAQYNYGLKLLRGRGVARDLDEGRRFIDLAAANGDTSAQELAADNYDLSNVVGIGEDRLHKSAAKSGGAKAARTQ